MGTNGKRRRSKEEIRRTQTKVMRDLRIRLAEQGHLVQGVSKHFRTDHQAFLAIPKNNPRQFVLVEPSIRDLVRVRPFCCQGTYQVAKSAVAETNRLHNRRVFWVGEIMPRRRNLKLEHFLTPEGEKRIRQLTGYP